MTATIGLGWRVVHSSSAVVVGVSGPATAPVVVHRAEVALFEDDAAREPYHTAVGRPIDDVPAWIRSVEEAAAAAATSAIGEFVSSLGPVAAVGVVGGNRKLPELTRILSKHALLHAADRDLYEQAVIEGASRAGLPVTAIPATGRLFADASALLGVALEPTLAALGKTVGAPWGKDYKEATAAALVALASA